MKLHHLLSRTAALMVLTIIINAALFSQNNTWQNLTGVTIEIPSALAGGSFSQRGWGNMKWDTDSQRIVMMEGYNLTNDAAGYSIYSNAFYTINPITKQFRLFNYSSYWTGNGNQFTPGPPQAETPHPRHCYGAVSYINNYHQLYMGFGACSGSNNCENTHVWKHNSQTDNWTKSTPVWPGYNYDQNFIHFNNSDTLWILGPNSGGWYTLSAFDLANESLNYDVSYGITPFASYQSMTAEDDYRKEAIVTSNTGVFIFKASDHSLTQLTNVPSAINGGSASVCFDSKYKVYFLHNEDGTDWNYDPASGQWDQLTTFNSPIGINDYIHRNIVYDPINELVVTYDGTFRIIKHVPTAVGLGAKNNSEINITVYPNPAKDEIKLQLNTIKNETLIAVITDAAGRVVSKNNFKAGIGSTVFSVNISNFDAGLYFIHLSNETSSLYKKIVVE